MPLRGLIHSGPAAVAAVLLGAVSAVASEQHVMRLLATGQCPHCDLRGADLVHADLQRANLQGAQLQGANLSRANLSGANLQGADLRQASLVGANLSNARLLQTQLEGTDLREADLQGVMVELLRLRRANLDAAVNTPRGARSTSDWHNLGSQAFEAGQFAAAERHFSEAITTDASTAQSWIARSMARSKQGNLEGAKGDLNHALQLSLEANQHENASKIRTAIANLEAEQNPDKKGGRMHQSTAAMASIIKILAPLAMKAFSSGLF
jgi:uncharacterized protein YjbI with pentapeptide repeats